MLQHPTARLGGRLKFLSRCIQHAGLTFVGVLQGDFFVANRCKKNFVDDRIHVGLWNNRECI